MQRILIVEDDVDIGSGLRQDLMRHGYDAEIVSDGAEGCRRGRESCWDLILLDVMLPLMDGFAVCRELRRGGVRTPVILLTARAQEADKVFGFEIGADDYVTKPFSPRELRGRIKAVLRRCGEGEEEVMRFGDCEVDVERGEVRRGGRPIDITAVEFRLLTTLLRRRGRVFSREQLIEMAWGGNTNVTDRVVDTHVLNIRKKIEPDPANPQYLVSVS